MRAARSVARIVLIDDEVDLASVMAEILGAGGHEVILAATGAEGLAALRSGPPDIVVCDINMPGLDGFGVLRAIRGDPDLAALPFIFLTGEDEMRAGIVSGADDYLMKPVSARDLLAAVDARLLRGQTAKREADRRVDEVRHAVAALLPHEMRTPLTTIIGSARLLQEFHATFSPDEIAEMAGGILKAAQRLYRMTENYILFADLETRRLSGMPREYLLGSSDAADVQAAARDAAAQRERSASLELAVTEAKAPMGPAYLRKIVTELVDNALKFSAADTLVRVSFAVEGPDLVLEVTDHGHGMEAAQLRTVGAFQQFDRGHFEQQGSGVGLALVRGIAEATGGRFEITSRPAQGTTVRIRWTS
jgi:two-component system, sensor histidine kinase and response regulator